MNRHPECRIVRRMHHNYALLRRAQDDVDVRYSGI
jgi:hypothetical protein